MTMYCLCSRIMLMKQEYTPETVHFLYFIVTSVISEAKLLFCFKYRFFHCHPYDNENTGYKAAVITSTDISELVLAAGQKEETALPLTWQQAYLGDNSSISYAIEINLPKTNTEYNWSKKGLSRLLKKPHTI